MVMWRGEPTQQSSALLVTLQEHHRIQIQLFIAKRSINTLELSYASSINQNDQKNIII